MIREAVGADAERLTELMHTSAAYRGQYASIIAGYRVTPDYLDRTPSWVAVDPDGVIHGFATLQLDPPEIDLMFVADDLHGTGIGRALMATLLDDARQRGLDTLRVVAHPDAEGFYRRLGAHRIGTVPPSPPRITWERPELLFDLTALLEPDDQRSPRAGKPRTTGWIAQLAPTRWPTGGRAAPTTLSAPNR